MGCYPVDSGPTGLGPICPGNPGLRTAGEPRRALSGPVAWPSSPQSSDRACSARWVSAAAAARWRAARRSCWSWSPSPAAAARSCWRAASSWALAALRNARILAAIASSAAAREAAAWRCAEARRSLIEAGLASSGRTAFSSPIRLRIAARRCPISARRFAPGSGLSSTLPACPLPAVSPRMDAACRTVCSRGGSPCSCWAWPRPGPRRPEESPHGLHTVSTPSANKTPVMDIRKPGNAWPVWRGRGSARESPWRPHRAGQR